MKNTVDPLLVGLDIGSSKITLLVARREADGTLTYVEGMPAPVFGIHNGVVVNITDVTAAIKATLYEVEERCERRITSANVTISGPHLQSQSIHSAISIAPPGREIGDDDISRAITAARAELHLGPNREILHEIPRGYSVDGQGGVTDPREMMGYQLEADVHYATATSTTISNLLKCISQAGIEPAMLVAAPLAAGEAVRGAYDSERSFAIVDLGADLLSLTLYADGFVWGSEVFPLGGRAMTQALATELRLPPQVAEDIKLRYGYAGLTPVGEFDLLDLPPSAGFDALLPRSEICRIIQAQAQRIADTLQPRLREAQQAGYAPEALILTGGAADLPGLDDFLRYSLDLPVYRGTPTGIRELPVAMERPAFASVVGLLLWCASYTGPSDGKTSRRTIRTALPHMAANMKRIVRFVLP